MKLKIVISCLIFQIFLFFGTAQDCTLDLGGTHLETIIKIFQLNETQVAQVEGWQGELQVETKVIQEQAQLLFDTQPQRTPEELLALAEKYKILQDKMVNLSMSYDKKLLNVFNEKQYERYIALCEEAGRIPLPRIPE